VKQEGKVFVIPGEPGPKLSGDVDTEEFRGMFARPDEHLLLFAGRLEPTRNGPPLDAFRTALESRRSIRLVMAGEVRLIHTSRSGPEGGFGRQGEPPGPLGPAVLGLCTSGDLDVIPEPL